MVREEMTLEVPSQAFGERERSEGNSTSDGLDVTSPLIVLLIEDNAIDARLIQIMLSEAGSGLFELEHADRLSSGLKRLSQGDVGMVLLDLSLPDSMGLQTFERVHRAARGVPVIVMSGLDDQTVAVSAVH